MAAISSKPKVNVQKQNPFFGLRAFQTNEANLFFGRKRLNSELLLKLRQTRFLAIVGNSGTGKSSLVRAGLIPTVQSGFVAQAGSSWRVAVMQPNREPIQELTHALARRSVLHPNRKMEPNYPKQVENCLHRSSRGLMEAYKNAKIPNENLLIFIDQFEEVFQLYNQEKHIQSDRNQATKLINLLVAAVQQSEYPIYVVVTLRADFIEAANAFRDLPEIINNGQFLIPRMNRKELSQVIASPLHQAEVNITSRLKTRLLEDALDSQDQLPILQHCLMRTFDHWRKQNTSKPIDISNYEAVGGMKNALSIHANEAYDTLKNEEQKRLAAWLFKATTDHTSEGKGIRRRLDFERLCELTQANQSDMLEVVNIFRQKGCAFLVPSGRTPINYNTLISITQESMMRHWDRLVNWVAEEKQSAKTYKHLADQAQLYWKGEAGLWKNPELQLTTNWYEAQEPNVVWSKRYAPHYHEAISYLEKSQLAEKEALAQKEAQRQLQLKRSRRFNQIVGIAAILCLLLATFSLWMYYDATESKKEAQENAAKAELSTIKALLAQLDAEEKKELAAQERDEALTARQIATREKRRAYIERLKALEKEQEALIAKKTAEANVILAKQAEKSAKQAEKNAKYAEKNAEQSKKIAILERKNALIAKDKAIRAEMRSLAKEIAANAYEMQGKEDQSTKAFLTGVALRLFEDQGRKAQESAIYKAVSVVTKDPIMSSTSQLLAERDLDLETNSFVTIDEKSGKNIVGHWKIPNYRGQAFQSLGFYNMPVNTGVIYSLAVSPNENWIAAGYNQSQIVVWYTKDEVHSDPNYQLTLEESGGTIKEVVFIDNRNIIAVSNALNNGQKTSKLFKINLDNLGSEHSGNITPFTTHNQFVKDLSRSNDGAYIAYALSTGDTHIWGVSPKLQELAVIPDKEGVNCVAFDKDNRLVATGNSAGDIHLYQFDHIGNKSVVKITNTISAHYSPIIDLAFSPTDTYLSSSSKAKGLKMYNYKKVGVLYPIIEDHYDYQIWKLGFTKNGRKLVCMFINKQIGFLSTTTDQMKERLCERIIPAKLDSTKWQLHIDDSRLDKYNNRKYLCQ